MATSVSVCGICDLRHINQPSVVWCSECDEGLCLDCKEHHSLSKSSRNHSTITISEYQKLPIHVLNIREYCEDHNEKILLYCKQHDCPCCRICSVNNHSKCESVTTIETVIQNIKTSDLFQETEHVITEILNTIEILRKNRSENLSSVQKQKKYVIEEILETRTSINKHLDRVQEMLVNELAAVEKKVVQDTDEVLNSLKEKEKQFTEYQDIMTNIKEYASNLQTFLSIKDIERAVASKEESIHALINTKAMNYTTLSFETDKAIQNFPANIQTLGKITIQSLPCEISVSRKRDRKAQMMIVPTPSIVIESISLQLQQTINTQMSSTRGCVLLPDGKMVFSCYNSDYVRSFNTDGSQNFAVGKQQLQTYTFDIAYIEDTYGIAVTSGENDNKQCINIIDVSSGRVKKTIPTKSRCFGIVYRNNTLIFAGVNKGLRRINLSDNAISDIFTCELTLYAYVAVFRDNFYYTNEDSHSVTCCDLQGNIRWQFKDESILQNPLGITVDSDGNVYVVGGKSTNVVVISSDGQYSRRLLSKQDGLEEPRVLHYERSSNRLLVANKRAVAFLFKLLS